MAEWFRGLDLNLQVPSSTLPQAGFVLAIPQYNRMAALGCFPQAGILNKFMLNLQYFVCVFTSPQ